MADLVVGHTTPDSTRIWIRGDERYRWARVSLSADGEHRVESEPLKLLGEDDFTAVAPFTNLREETRYRVTARFASSLRGLEQDRSDQSAREGRLRTFPPPDAKTSFSFLHGSCNLSIVSLTNLGSLAAGALGTLAATKSLERKAHGSWGWKLALRFGNGLVFIVYGLWFLWKIVSFPFRWVVSRLSRQPRPEWPKRHGNVSLVYAVFLIVYRLTGFKQRAPLLPNPYKKLNEVLEKGLSNVADERVPSGPPPEFMIHAGDQIYFDFPFPQRAPTEAAYRLAYKEAWFEDDQFRRFLSQCPQYMTLDDHEIVDGFATDGVVPKGRDPYEYLEPATQAYREYVNSRHPTADDSLFYKFDYGTTRFFVMDTRTQRSDHSGEMIDPKQMCRFKEWLIKYKDDVKFVVSSIPFVAEVKSKETEASRSPDERDDKWSGRPFRAQRGGIIHFLHENRIERVVFLVGDMHCCYHASMRIGWPHDRTTVHELAGGPVYQLQFGSRDDFLDEHRDFVGSDEKLPFRTSLQQLHGAASGVLHVTVTPGASPEVRWQVVRTSPDLRGTFKPRSLSGRIRFEEHRHL